MDPPPGVIEQASFRLRPAHRRANPLREPVPDSKQRRKSRRVWGKIHIASLADRRVDDRARASGVPDLDGAARGPIRDAATFSRDLNVTIDAITLPMSSAPGFRGDPSRVNPEQLFVASLSACQALTYLFLAARNQIAIVQYSDDAQGWLELVDGKMRMSRVLLRPRITLEPGADEATARQLVERAHANCFIANSVATTVAIEPALEFAATAVAS